MRDGHESIGDEGSCPREKWGHWPCLRYLLIEIAAWCDAHEAKHTLANPNAVGRGGPDAVVTARIRCWVSVDTKRVE
jgi:hypothetical protein